MLFNFADVHEAIAAAVPEREALVWRDRRLTYEQLASRSRRLAFYLNQRGIGLHTERAHLAGHESGQDHVALYLYNGNEYVEGMLGAFKARAASLNVNYRYVEEELHYLFDNSQCRALIYHSAFAERVASIRDRLPRLEVLIQVQDESGAALLPGAVDYEEALASVPDEPVEPAADTHEEVPQWCASVSSTFPFVYSIRSKCHRVAVGYPSNPRTWRSKCG